MATYEYKCNSCGTKFEEERKMGDTLKLPKCPKCKSSKNVRKIISLSSVSFKGQGFTKSLDSE